MDIMRNIKNEIYNIIKGVIVSLIANILLDFYNNDFSISKMTFDSLISTFVEFWWLVLIIFILVLLRFKMSEKPHKINYHHRHAEFRGRRPILHDGGIWEIVVEEINPLFTYNTSESNINYYVDKIRCCNELNNGELCLSELYLIDIGFCYLEKCDNCSFKRVTLKSHDREISEILTKIDALIVRKDIKDCYELLDVLSNEEEL
ncbi:MAG: hypothetical protein ILA26_09010 [Methanobrevibacter sp.]|uniref:hypothetical protein n=1 Tax=Methanobrevibacter sp. TaxID=66852 RepID=UPI001B784570|nr:hypothetical protein [Methanobrevibacter sp.]MBP3792155.1 hypothetical protein [Methanobrevibacter sp.]